MKDIFDEYKWGEIHSRLGAIIREMNILEDEITRLKEAKRAGTARTDVQNDIDFDEAKISGLRNALEIILDDDAYVCMDSEDKWRIYLKINL